MRTATQPARASGSASASFLREHYTTGSDMASTMADYLSGVGTEAAAGRARHPMPAAAPPADARRAARSPLRRAAQAERRDSAGRADRPALRRRRRSRPSTPSAKRAGREARPAERMPPTPRRRRVLEPFEE